MHGCCEYDNFVDFSHLCQELVAAWPDEEGALAADFEVVDEGLVEIEDEAVASAALLLWEIWWVWSRQRLVAADRCAANAVEWRQIRILFEFFNFFTGLDDVVSHLAQGAVVEVLQRSIDDHVERPEGSPRHHRALEEALVPHLQQSLGRHVGPGSCLLALSYDSLKYVDYLIVHLAYAHLALCRVIL